MASVKSSDELRRGDAVFRLRQAGAKTGLHDLDQAIRSSQLDTVKLLARRNPELNARNKGGGDDTPLNVAAEDGQLEMVKVLLDAGADIDGAPGAQQPTPLDAAISHERPEVEEFLISRGASLGKKTPDMVEYADALIRGRGQRGGGRVNVVKKAGESDSGPAGISVGALKHCRILEQLPFSMHIIGAIQTRVRQCSPG